MAVIFDAVGPSSAGGGTTGGTTATSASWSHTCTGSNRALIVGVAIGLTGSGTTTATYNSVPMTSLGLSNSGGGGFGYVQLFGLINPASGSNAVAISTTIATISGGSISFTGAAGFGTATTALASSPAASAVVAGTTAGNIVVDVVCTGTLISGSAQTNQWLKNTNAATAAGNGAGSTAAAGGSVTMSYTVTNDWWGMVAVEVQASGAASTAPPDPGLLVSRLRPYFG